MTTHITITGTHGTGKSTLTRTLHDICRGQHKKVCMITEVADDCPYLINERTTPQAQEWIWHEQLKRELATQNADPSVIICDRSLMDNLCYYKHIESHDEETFEMLYAITKEWMKTYTYVVRLPLDIGRLQSGNNPNRSKDITFAREIDKIFDELVDPFVNVSEDALVEWCRTSECSNDLENL